MDLKEAMERVLRWGHESGDIVCAEVERLQQTIEMLKLSKSLDDIERQKNRSLNTENERLRGLLVEIKKLTQEGCECYHVDGVLRMCACCEIAAAIAMKDKI